MNNNRQGLMASFDYLDSTVESIKALRGNGFDEITAFAPFAEHKLEQALGYGTSPVRLFTLVGGLTGAATGFAFTIFTAMDWPLVTGGKPILSIPAYVVIAFEMTILFGVLATVIGVSWSNSSTSMVPTTVVNRTVVWAWAAETADRLHTATSTKILQNHFCTISTFIYSFRVLFK